MNSAEHAPPVGEPSVLDDLRARLRGYRRVDVPTGFGWTRGVDGDYLADLVSYWADSYDWRKHEARLRALPWVLTGATDLSTQGNEELLQVGPLALKSRGGVEMTVTATVPA